MKTTHKKFIHFISKEHYLPSTSNKGGFGVFQAKLLHKKRHPFCRSYLQRSHFHAATWHRRRRRACQQNSRGPEQFESTRIYKLLCLLHNVYPTVWQQARWKCWHDAMRRLPEQLQSFERVVADGKRMRRIITMMYFVASERRYRQGW